MAKIIQNVTVEVSKPNYFQAIVAKQFDDNSRFLRVTLVNGSEKINVLPTSTATINARRKDGAEKPFKGEVNEDGTVTVPLTYWMLELEGTVECDVSIIDEENSKLTSTNFIVRVEKASCANPDVTDADKYDILILQGQNIVGSVNGRTGIVELSADDVGAASKEEFAKAVNSLADIVCEQGVSGEWTYRKWSSGLAECWCSHAHIVAEAVANGGSLQFTLDLPFEFADNTFLAFIHPMFNAYKVRKVYSLSTTKNSVTVYVKLDEDKSFDANEKVGVCINIKGRW